jgi:predicted signal transduction protein with EAL and GGDEF domain
LQHQDGHCFVGSISANAWCGNFLTPADREDHKVRIDMSAGKLLQTLKENPHCQGCNSGAVLDIEFEFAFQPIVDLSSRTVFAHEALVRGPNNESAYSILSKITDQNRYQFDRHVA